jgi:uncharacterized membrane protein YjgN (DUF898 family)
LISDRQTHTGPQKWQVYVAEGGNQLFQMSLRGVMLMVITLGLYRFWFVSDLRRFFWSRTSIDSSPLEYTGRGLELFVGFLIAVAVLLPLSLGFFGLSLVSPTVAIVGNLAYFIVMWFLGQYALYRARRYRLNRTIWRGLRLYLSGSAWKYAFASLAWVIVAIFTFGLVWPWASASLERFRVNNTWFGNLRLHSTARWSDIVKPYAIIWLLVGFPFIALVVSGIWMEYNSDIKESTLGLSGGLKNLWAIALYFGAIAPFLGLLLYPWYKAVILRTYFSHITAGTASLEVTFSTGLFYKIWFKMIGVMLLVSIVLGLAGAVVYPLLSTILPDRISSAATFPVILGVIGYVIWIAVNYVVTITIYHFGIWYHVGKSMTILNPASIEEAQAGSGKTVGGINEGFADALDVGGGFEIGL